MVLLITYDLHGPGRNYSAIHERLSRVPHCHPEGSVWFIDTDSSPSAWVDELKRVGDNNDEFLITRVYRDWTSYNQETAATTWLKSPLRRW